MAAIFPAGGSTIVNAGMSSSASSGGTGLASAIGASGGASNAQSAGGWFSNAAGGLGGLSISGALFNVWGSRKQNKENARQAQIARDWDKMMSDTAVQRRVEDLKAAGLNPMLAYMNQASTPSSPVAPVQSESDAGLRGIVAGQSAAQMALTQASARKTEAEASLLESQVPYSAKNAMWQSESIRESFDKLAHEVHNLQLDEKIKGNQVDLSDQQLREVVPLAIEYQKLLNRAQQLGIPEKQATADFFSEVPEGKWAQILMKIIQGGASVLRGVR